MKSRKPSRRQILSSCHEIGPDDGVDPRTFFRDPARPKTNRKALQLCGQVARTLQAVLAGETGDDLLRELQVESVVPAPTSARLLVTLTAFAFAMRALVGASPLVAALFAIGFGAANGVMTVARGALPLVMFGPAGYGRVIGRIARPGLFVQALAPFVVASAVERFSNRTVFEAAIVGALLALACFLGIRAPRS